MDRHEVVMCFVDFIHGWNGMHQSVADVLNKVYDNQPEKELVVPYDEERLVIFKEKAGKGADKLKKVDLTLDEEEFRKGERSIVLNICS